ncbi:phospholipase A2 inhibitor and Ly6/PLAUR domain-containing protein-like [Clupea harengus]|uniref:Phospholipase A2 inhibitor and Ly6/PLAUR domain-containing protein-like n=1 Tax=Clupea harengus TaxID=7950 RepID=A0A6P8G8N2_CLUHA|nr:phospholipase A2 inhibitor and Ly6/PLAUR domain-containing protein-like [Clupea harengus]
MKRPIYRVDQHMYVELLTVKMVIEVIFVAMCLLVPQAKGLQCTTCKDVSGSCNGVECPALDYSCASISVTTVIGGSTTEGSIKSCFPSSLCLNGSLNTGALRVTLSTLCCNTDNCNSGSLPAAVNNTANGRQCFTCGSADCSLKLQCAGDEDRCFNATGNLAGLNATVKGCATQSVCSGAFSQALDSVAAGLRCCEGDLCNSAWSATHSVLFLLWPLGSVLLFH